MSKFTSLTNIPEDAQTVIDQVTHVFNYHVTHRVAVKDLLAKAFPNGDAPVDVPEEETAAAVVYMKLLLAAEDEHELTPPVELEFISIGTPELNPDYQEMYDSIPTLSNGEKDFYAPIGSGIFIMNCVVFKLSDALAALTMSLKEAQGDAVQAVISQAQPKEFFQLLGPTINAMVNSDAEETLN